MSNPRLRTFLLGSRGYPLYIGAKRLVRREKMLKGINERWSATDASELYDVQRWGKGYFSVHTDGNLHVHPTKESTDSIDLKQLVDLLEQRGVDLPVLVRFSGVLKNRIQELHASFAKAISDFEYQGKYSLVYPIKVNQQRQVVEEVVRFGSEYGFGLEAGSKPELLAVVAMTNPETPIICNGFKDGEFLEMAMMAQKIGRRVIPVVEKFTDLGLVLYYAQKVGVRPKIGVRVKLAARGAGRWQASGGYGSKFGLTVTEILDVLEELKRRDMADCFKLLHFHLGSQITHIRHVKNALTEAARVYADLSKRGAGLEILDVGGGLGVDYDGSQTNFESSVNYTLQEYCNDIVYYIRSVCDDANVPHPHIVSESGRAVVAYHSALLFGTLGVSGQGREDVSEGDVDESLPAPIRELSYAYQEVVPRNVLETFHDAQQALETTMSLFSTGHLTLEHRAVAERIFWAVCRKIRTIVDQMEYIPEELQRLDQTLADTYFCNFSVFQSIPDSWAIKQLFPIMPIHRLNQRPTRHAVIADITCDSDGKIDQFIDQRDIKRTLLLHPFDGEPYILGAFLIGAYQEILGDLHNLFGDTNAVHVDMTADGEVIIESMIRGDTVSEVLDYVEFHHSELVQRLQSVVEMAVREGRLTHPEAGRFLRFYEEALNGYTYLEETPEQPLVEKTVTGSHRPVELVAVAAESR